MTYTNNPSSFETLQERLQTYSNWPTDVVSKEDLAEAGFWYKGPGDTVRCFMCNVEIGDWEEGDHPRTEHLKFSPDCPYLRWHSSSRNASAGTSNSPEITEEQVRQRLVEGYQRLYNKYIFADARNTVRRKLSNYERAFPSSSSGSVRQATKENLRNSQNERVDMGRVGNETAEAPYYVQDQQHLGHRATLGNTTEGRNMPSRGPQQLPSSTGEGDPMEYCQNLEAIATRAKHPEYADINVRLRTFSSWPRSQVVQPRELTEAGFYYTGQDDRVRCFACDGGLCNWDCSDIPWYEHARWYGNCPYVNDCKRNPVVTAIIDTARQMETAQTTTACHHHHHHHHGHTQCDAQGMTA